VLATFSQEAQELRPQESQKNVCIPGKITIRVSEKAGMINKEKKTVQFVAILAFR